MARLKIMLTAAFVLIITFNAYGASLTYSPEDSFVTVPAGTSMDVPMTINLLDGGWGTYYLTFVGRLDGGIPSEWITSSPSIAFVSKYWMSATTTMKVTVPDGTEPGTYTGYLFSKAKSTHSYADEGGGMYLEVYVPSNCGSTPTVDITSFGPEYLWPPNHSMQSVTISGNVVLPDGCTLYEIGYSIDDEYGIYTGVGTVTVGAGGEFNVAVPVEASRQGSDKDGRHYTITIYAENDAGIGMSSTINVTVPHDQRK